VITHLVGVGMTVVALVSVAPSTIDSLEGQRDAHELNNLRSDASSIGKAVIEEALLSDSGDTCPTGLTVSGNRIESLPSIRLGSADNITIWHDNSCTRVQVVVTNDDGTATAVWDNDAPQILTTYRDGVVVEQA
jgi:hypothetical protein